MIYVVLKKRRDDLYYYYSRKLRSSKIYFKDALLTEPREKLLLVISFELDFIIFWHAILLRSQNKKTLSHSNSRKIYFGSLILIFLIGSHEDYKKSIAMTLIWVTSIFAHSLTHRSDYEPDWNKTASIYTKWSVSNITLWCT